MSRAKYTTDEAKEFLKQYGYTAPENFEFKNMNQKIRLYDVYNEQKVSLSMKQVEYYATKAATKRPKYTKPEQLNDIMNIDYQPGKIALSHDERKQMYDILNDIQTQPSTQPQQQTQQERIFKNVPEAFDYINYYIPTSERQNVINQIKSMVPKLIRDIKAKMSHNQSLIEPISPANQESAKNALLITLKMMKKDLLKVNCSITLTSTDGKQKKFYFNENSLNLLESALFHHDVPNPHDSNEEIVNQYFIKDLAQIQFDFAPLKENERKTAGFFPFINYSTIDLSDFGIYGKDDKRRLNESCLILAIRQSGVLNEQEMKRLKHFIKTRTFLIEQLPEICEEFDVSFNVRIMKKDVKHADVRKYGKSERLIRLIVMYGHYMVDKLPNVSSYFLNNYSELKDENKMIFKNKEGIMTTTKTSLNIPTVIQRLIEMKLLIPMTIDEIIDIKINFDMKDEINFNHQRLVKINNKERKYNFNVIKPKQTKFFFGYQPEPDAEGGGTLSDEIDERLNELQKVVDSLPLRHRVIVSDYYRYSELMRKIMFEYGCFDGVFESTGEQNQKLRSEIHYPRPHSGFNDGEPFEIHDKLYYIDMNSSYMSFIDGIPTDLTMTKRNYKINDLIKTFYEIRREKKRTNPKLATTLKFLMNSCFGYSLKKQKLYKNKFTNNLNFYTNAYQSFIFAIYPTEENKGFVHSRQSFSPDYNVVQFGYDILKNYNEFMNKIKQKVNVYFENIDAILINEADYLKLQAEGLIGENLGQFKIEHIFKSFEYISPRHWRGIDIDGTITTRGKWN